MSAPVALRLQLSRTSALLGLLRTQHKELVRQPVFGVVLALGLTLVGLSPALAVFSLGPAEALVLDLGASTMLFFAVFLASASVAAGVAEKLQDGTTALLLTRPVGPGAVLLGGYLGAALALGQACLLMAATLVWASRAGPDVWHLGVLIGAIPAVVVPLGGGIWASLGDRPPQAAMIQHASWTFPLGALVSVVVERDGSLLVTLPRLLADPEGTAGGGYGAPLFVALAAALLAWLASLAFAALGTALATRLPGEVAAALTLAGFVLASLVQAGLGSSGAGVARILGGGLAVGSLLALLAQAARVGWGWLTLQAAITAGVGAGAGFLLLTVPGLDQSVVLGAAVGGLIPLGWAVFAVFHWERASLPLSLYGLGLLVTALGRYVLEGGVLALLLVDLQLYWVADAAYTNVPVPWSYLGQMAGYTALYVLGWLGLGSYLLAGRELG